MAPLAAMLAAGLIIGFEETVETSIVAWALKKEYESDIATFASDGPG